ncbi:MAG TPA: hypothetical protein VJB82_04570 [Candidatus Peribacterales bacterium]|nr:hypothetical protein [Candidatus Peribacterales bacterium]
MIETTLYLRADEKKLFLNLSKDLQEGWKIAEETIDAYERPEELKMRSFMLRTKTKECKAAFEQYSHLTKDLAAEALFTLGAEGISKLLLLFLSVVKTDEDIKGVAELSHIRHALLVSNTKHSPTHS